MSAVTKPTHDELLDALALVAAHRRQDLDAVQSMLSRCDPRAVHSLLLVSEMIAETLAAFAKHKEGEVIAAIRRQLIFEREKATSLGLHPSPKSSG